MKVFYVQETIKGIDGVANVTNRGTFLKYDDAQRLFARLVKFGELKDPLFIRAVNHGGFATYSNGRASWGTHDGELHQFDLIESYIDIPTVYDELKADGLTSDDTQKADFETRFEHDLGELVREANEKSYDKNDSTLEDMLYNSGEFSIVFQCEDKSKVFSTSLPYEAESFNQIVEALRAFARNCY